MNCTANWKHQSALGREVRLYRNLHRGGLSVQLQGPTGWRVAGWLTSGLYLVDQPTLWASEAGRRRIRLTGVRNVHAWIQGTLHQTQEWDHNLTPLRYHPVNLPGWVNPTGQIVTTGKYLIINAGTGTMAYK
jgi:hypothetical protein